MSNHLKVGIIGTGFIGRQHIEAVRRVPGAEVAAVVDSNAQVAKAVSEELGIGKWYDDYHALLEDASIDAIHNCTPSMLHYPINKEAILKGKHVYCEKPLAMDSSESQKLADLAERHDLALGVNFNYRHNAVVQEMRQLVKNGSAGRVFMLTGEYLQDWLLYDTDYDWRLNPAMGGRARTVADIGSHLFDTSQFVTGKKIASVYAELLTVYPVRRRLIKGGNPAVPAYEDVRVDSEDAGFILGRFEDGTPFSFVISQVSAGKKNALSLTVSGSNELLEWDQQKPDILNIGHRDTPNEVMFADPKFLTGGAKSYGTLPAGHALGWHDAFTQAIKSFYSSIFDNSYKNPDQNYATFKTGHEIMRVVDACLESSAKKQWIEL